MRKIGMGLAVAVMLAAGMEVVTAEAGEQAVLPGGEPCATARQEESGRKWHKPLDVVLGLTGILQGAGVPRETRSEGYAADATFSADLDILAAVSESGTAFLHLEAGNGSGLDADLATLSGLNADADPAATLRLPEAWYERQWLEARLKAQAGKIDLTALFDANAFANCEIDQFLSGGFVNNMAVEFPADDGAGAAVRWEPAEILALAAGAGDADADQEDVFKNSFVIGQIDLHPSWGGRQGHYRAYAWMNNQPHTRLADPTVMDEKNWGFGASCDQEITDSLGVFFRYGRQRQEVAAVAHAWSAGVQMAGDCFGRSKDVVAAGFGAAVLGSDWKRAAQDAGLQSADEYHAEVYYRAQLNDHLAVTPDVQWVCHPNGEAARPAVWAVGVRTQMWF